MPPWAKQDTQKLQGKLLSIVCSGTGPSVDLARADAIQGCQASASRHVAGDVRVQTLSVETERDAVLHQEVEQQVTVSNLMCQPDREEIEENGDGFRVWLQCRFDLSKAKTKANAAETDEHLGSKSESSISNRDALRQFRKRSIQANKSGSYNPSQMKTTLSIASVPACDSLVIRGRTPRTLPCKSNPMPVVIESGDERIIVRARDHMPKTIELSKTGRRPADESVEVILDQK